MISAASSSRMRQHRRQTKKTEVFSGFTNQLKEVSGQLRGSRWCRKDEEAPRLPPPPSPRLWPRLLHRTARTLGLLRGLWLLAPLSHWTFLSLLHSQQLKLSLHLPLEKG